MNQFAIVLKPREIRLLHHIVMKYEFEETSFFTTRKDLVDLRALIDMAQNPKEAMS